jgi:hypothetical protein
MVPVLTTSMVEDIFGLAVNVTRSIWINLPSLKRRTNVRPCLPVLELHAITSEHIALVGTVTPVSQGVPKGLICNLREIVQEGQAPKYQAKGYPRTDTYEHLRDQNQSIWVVSD